MYNFRGVGQEPLPDGHVKIQCRCRQKIVHKVVIQNNSEHTATFEMLTALPFVKGQPVIQLKGREKLEYELEVDAKKSGTFKDSIYFYNRAEDTYIWYSAEVCFVFVVIIMIDLLTNYILLLKQLAHRISAFTGKDYSPKDPYSRAH